MGKIYCLMGKSSTGKDTIYKKLLEDKELALEKIVPYTTRPIREGETQGIEYHFTDESVLNKLKEDNKIIECRKYDTIHGIWYYFMVKDDQIDLEHKDYVIIGTLESYLMTREYFGNDIVVPIYIDLDDGERLARALNRERQQQVPKYEEMCRRFLADSKDFSEDRLLEAGIKKRFINENLDTCIQEIKQYIFE